MLKYLLTFLLLAGTSVYAQETTEENETFRISSVQVKSGINLLPVSDADHKAILYENTAPTLYPDHFRHLKSFDYNYRGVYKNIFLGITLQRAGAGENKPELRLGLAIADLGPYQTRGTFDTTGITDTGTHFSSYTSKGKFLFNSFNVDYLVYGKSKYGIPYLGLNANIGQASWFSRNTILSRDSAGTEQTLKIATSPVSTLSYGLGLTAGFKINLWERMQLMLELYAGAKGFSNHLATSPKFVYDCGAQLGLSYVFFD